MYWAVSKTEPPMTWHPTKTDRACSCEIPTKRGCTWAFFLFFFQTPYCRWGGGGPAGRKLGKFPESRAQTARDRNIFTNQKKKNLSFGLLKNIFSGSDMWSRIVFEYFKTNSMGKGKSNYAYPRTTDLLQGASILNFTSRFPPLAWFFFKVGEGGRKRWKHVGLPENALTLTSPPPPHPHPRPVRKTRPVEANSRKRLLF